MKPELLTVDLDDTLWDAAPALEEAETSLYAWLRRRYPRIGGRLSLEELQRRRQTLAEERPELAHDFTRLRHASLSLLAREAGYDPALADAGLELFIRIRSRVSLFAEAEQALASLAAAYRLVALSNGNADLHIAGVSRYFDFAVTPTESGTAKPDPAMFTAVSRRSGVAAQRIVHIGDQPLHDIAGARQAGMRAIWVNRAGVPWPADQPPPAGEVRRLDEVLTIIENLD